MRGLGIDDDFIFEIRDDLASSVGETPNASHERVAGCGLDEAFSKSFPPQASNRPYTHPRPKNHQSARETARAPKLAGSQCLQDLVERRRANHVEVHTARLPAATLTTRDVH